MASLGSCICCLFHFILEYYSIAWTYHIFNPFTSWSTCGFPFFSCYEQGCWEHSCTVSKSPVLLGIHLGVELLGLMVTQRLAFWGAATLSSTVDVPLYVCTKSAVVTLSPYPHQYLLFVVFLMIAILKGVRWISLWFWFAFPWWLVMLSIFSCACWPSVCHLFGEKKSISVLLPFF